MHQPFTVLAEIPLSRKYGIFFWTFSHTLFFLQGTLIKQIDEDFEL